MPWMAVEKDYAFDGPAGKVSLLDLCEGRRQLIVYRAFFEPGVHGWPDHGCIGCSLVADQVGHLFSLNARDTTLVYASRAPQADIARLKERMGWQKSPGTRSPTVSTPISGSIEWHGHNAFIRDEDRIFRTYLINSRGDEAMGTVWSYLDMTALGRQEEWEEFARRLPADPEIQVVELERQLRSRRRARPEMGQGVGRGRGGFPQQARLVPNDVQAMSAWRGDLLNSNEGKTWALACSVRPQPNVS